MNQDLNQNSNQNQKTKTEIEGDLRQFLTAVSPLIKAVQKNSNRSMIYTVSSVTKEIATDKEFLTKIKECAPLLEKYKYLIDGI